VRHVVNGWHCLSLLQSLHFAGVVKACLTQPRRCSSTLHHPPVLHNLIRYNRSANKLLHPDVLFHSTQEAKTLCSDFVEEIYCTSTVTADPLHLHPLLNPDDNDFAVNDDTHDLIETVRVGGDAVALLEAPSISTIPSVAVK
jgi:hypothetical protein